MQQLLTGAMEKVIQSSSAMKLTLLNQVLPKVIPFNRPHRFRVLQLTPHNCRCEIPFKPLNKNHLGGIHACAFATAGEYSAGLLLLQNLGMSKYRIILRDLNISYSKQGRAKVYAEAHISQAQLKRLSSALEKDGVTDIKLETHLQDQNGERLALCKTHWQVKDWNLVRSKK